MAFKTIALLAVTVAVSAQPNGYYLESNGLVAIEIEAHDSGTNGNWILGNSLTGWDGSSFSGSGYYLWDSSKAIVNNPQGILSYNVWINTPGDYTFRMHNYHACPDGSECNDIFVKMNNDAWEKAFSNPVGIWIWDTLFHHPNEEPEWGFIKFTLAAGANTLYIGGRSHNMAIDRVHLSTWHPQQASICAPLSQRAGMAPIVDPPCTEVIYNDPAPSEDGYVYLPSIDLGGNDIWSHKGSGIASPEACAQHCASVAGCVAWTWHAWSSDCYPKHKMIGRKDQGGATSGYHISIQPPQGPGATASPVATAGVTASPVATAPIAGYSYDLVTTPEGNQGCCRCAAGNDCSLVHHPTIKDSAECANLCSDLPTCVAYEITNHEGCELHQEEITHVSNNALCQCFVKVELTAPPVEAVTGTQPTPEPTLMPSAAPTPMPSAAAIEFYQGSFSVLGSYTGGQTIATATAELRISRGASTSEIRIAGNGFPAEKSFMAHLHVASCAVGGGAHYQNPACSPGCTVNAIDELWPTVLTDSSGGAAGLGLADWTPSSQDVGTLSVIIHDETQKWLCADLVVPAPTCTQVVGIDLDGSDIPGSMNLAAAGADECAELCINHPLCTHFTFIWNGCYLKTSDAGKKNSNTGISGWCTENVEDYLDSTNGPNGKGCGLGTIVDEVQYDGSFTCDCTETAFGGDNCDDILTDHSCQLEDGYNYDQNDISGFGNIAVDSAEECAVLCQANTDCNAFTYAWTKCYLKTSPAGRESKNWPGLVSGVCNGDIVTDEPDTPEPVTSAPITASKTCVANLVQINLDGHDIAGGTHISTANAEECAILCEANELCMFFTYIWSHCYLKDSDAGSKYAYWGISGSCTIEEESGDEVVEVSAMPTPAPAETSEVSMPPTLATMAPTQVPTPMPSAAPAVTPETPSFAYTEILAHNGGSGCCRPESGKPVDSVMVAYHNVKVESTCKAMCDLQESCNAYEFHATNGCELHENAVKVNLNTACSCFLKMEEGVTQPPSASPEPSNYIFLGNGCCRTSDGGPGTAVEQSGVTTLAACEAFCETTEGCVAIEYKPTNDLCEAHTTEIALFTNDISCNCYVRPAE